MKKVILALVLACVLIVMPIVFALTVERPEDDETYNSRLVLFSLSADEKSSFYYMNENLDSGRWRKLCDKTETCVKKISALEGENSFLLKSVYGDSSPETESVSFFVDSKKPVISRTYPLSSYVVNEGPFSVRYSEDNLKEVTLYYGNDGDIEEKSSSECVSGKDKQCDFSLELEDYDGQYLEYWFMLDDGINNATSRKTRVKVDLTAPTIDDYSITANDNNVKFIVDITEENFKDVLIEDTSVLSRNYFIRLI